MGSHSHKSDEQDRCNPVSNNRYRLSNTEGKSPRHVQGQTEVRSDGKRKGDGIDSEEPDQMLEDGYQLKIKKLTM